MKLRPTLAVLLQSALSRCLPVFLLFCIAAPQMQAQSAFSATFTVPYLSPGIYRMTGNHDGVGLHVKMYDSLYASNYFLSAVFDTACNPRWATVTTDTNLSHYTSAGELRYDHSGASVEAIQNFAHSPSFPQLMIKRRDALGNLLSVRAWENSGITRFDGSGLYTDLGPGGDLLVACGARDTTNASYSNVQLFKIKPNDSLSWSKKFYGFPDIYFPCSVHAAGQNYFFSGVTYHDLTTLYKHDAVITSVDSMGNTNWSTIYEAQDGYQFDVAGSALTSSGIVVAGTSNDTLIPDNQVGLFKLDADGAVQWAYRYHVPQSSFMGMEIISVATRSNGDIAVLFRGPPLDACLLQLDSMGNINWCIGFPGLFAHQLVASGANEWMIGGLDTSNFMGIQFERVTAGGQNCLPHYTVNPQRSAMNLAATAAPQAVNEPLGSSVYTSGETGITVSLASSCGLLPNSTGPETGTSASAVIFPNPASDRISLLHAGSVSEIRFYSLQGQLLDTRSLQPGVDNIALPALATGVYLAELVSASGRSYQRLVIRR